MDKIELLDRIEKSWTQINTLLTGLTDDQMIAHPNDHEWSINDLVSHLTFWQQTMVTNLQRRERGETMAHIDGQLDDINAQVFAANQFRPPALVLSEFRQAHEQLIARLQTITNEELNDKTLSFRDQNPLYDYILGESAEHYDEHLSELRAAREKVKRTR